MRADAKGIVQSTDLVPDGPRRTATLTLLHHPTGATLDAHAGLGRARRARRTRSSSCTSTSRRGRRRASQRVGDCVAPRRAHAAVVEGERVGALAVIAVVCRARAASCPSAATRPSPRPAGGALLVGDRHRRGGGQPGRHRRTDDVTLAEVGAYAPGAWAGAARPARWPTSTSSCCRPRPTGATSRPGWPTSSAGRCSPARSQIGADAGPTLVRQGGLRGRGPSPSPSPFVATLQPGVRGVGRRPPPATPDVSAGRRSPSSDRRRRRRRADRGARRPTRPPSTSPRRSRSSAAAPASAAPSRSPLLGGVAGAARRLARRHPGRHRRRAGSPRAPDRHHRRHRRPRASTSRSASAARCSTSPGSAIPTTSSRSTPTRTAR